MNPNTDFIPFARPSLSVKEEEAVLKVIRSGWLTTGAAAAELERRTAEITRARHSLAVNSATSGLHLALEASGVGVGDYVITSPYTFTATAEVIRYCGAHPLFADIEPGGFNISADEILRVIEKKSEIGGRIAAVMPVHVGGELCTRKRIAGIARSFSIPVIEDGAHLFPSPIEDGMADIIVYSFYATKCMTTGEGGMVVTDNDSLAKRMRTMRFHGFSREAWDRYNTKDGNSWEYDIVAAGFKYNLPDMLAAMGIVQLERASEMLNKRRLIAKAYDEAFGGCDLLEIPPDHNGSRHLYILRIIPERLDTGRDQLVRELADSGIGISVHYKPLHLMTYYSRKYGLKPGDFPESLDRFEKSFSIPIYPDLTEDEISRIINTVLDVCEKHRR